MSLEAGVSLPPLAIAPISRATLALFADASGDHNPIHLDVDAARAAGSEDVFAQGMLLMAYAGRFLTGLIPQERIRSFRACFVAPAPPQAQPVVTARVVSVAEAGGERQARLIVTVTLSTGATVLRGEAIVAVD